MEAFLKLIRCQAQVKLVLVWLKWNFSFWDVGSLYKLNWDIILIVQYEVLGGTQNVEDDGPTAEV